MWEIYDELINTIPEDIIVDRFLAGLHWFLVGSSSGVGMAMTPREGAAFPAEHGNIAGKPVREIARLIKSWNNYEAALGLAAINSVLNKPDKVAGICKVPPDAQEQTNVFDYMKDEIAGKKVAVIGHFRGLENLRDICSLSILERKPVAGDMPDPSCEYILPQQDYVFITATTLINKTLPRLLELSRNSFVVLVGPSTPMYSGLFKHGIKLLAGTTVIDNERVWNLIQEGDQHEFFNRGARMVKAGIP